MPGFRRKRVGDQLRTIVSDLLTRRLQDPRLEGVRIVDVRVSPDLRNATLFFSVYPADDQRRESARTALEHATGFIRREMGRGLRLKVIPALRFVPDLAPEHADHIERLLQEIGPIDDQEDPELTTDTDAPGANRE